MTATPETIARHELAGLRVRVDDAPNADLVGIAGRVIRETTQTLFVRAGTDPAESLGSPDERPRQVPKRGTTFVFRLPGDSTVCVEGERLLARPARRSESGGVSPWV